MLGQNAAIELLKLYLTTCVRPHIKNLIVARPTHMSCLPAAERHRLEVCKVEIFDSIFNSAYARSWRLRFLYCTER